MRVEVDHYQQKVESLRQTANQTMAKGKQIDNKSAEKLKRNEEKLLKIKESNTKFTAQLCLLTEEVTERAWRDLHPLLVKIAQFDVTLSADEAKAMASLNTVVSQLKKIADQHGINPQARLKDLETLDPQLLSTAKGESGTLQIEAGLGGLSFSSSSAMGSGADMHYPPGSTSPQGLGGFPVQIQSGNASVDGSARSTQSSSIFGGSAPSTMDMMNINAHAAPPPTMDTLSQAFGPSVSITGPSSGGMPPLGRSRNPSMDSFDSFRSGGSAPPPAAPPPPPPGQVPISGGYNPFGSSAAPNPFGGPSPGSTQSPSSNPFGEGPPALSYGEPSYGQQQSYGPQSYGHPGSAPPSYNYAPQNNFAQQPPMQAPPPPSSYGAPPMQPPQYPPPSQQPQQQQYLGYNPF